MGRIGDRMVSIDDYVNQFELLIEGLGMATILNTGQGGTGQDTSDKSGYPHLHNGTWVFPITGAVGNGVTDDTAALQDSATSAAGKVLSFAPGATYLVSTINISAGTTVLMTGATIKQDVLAALDGSPIFNVTGPNVTFRGGTLNGQRASQPADGFADAYNTGPNGTGKAYRAGIKADAVVNAGITNLRVGGVTFTLLYGGAVAALDVPIVRVTGCDIHDSNFELADLFWSAATLTDALVEDNTIRNIGTGHATVNASAMNVSQYARVTVRGNHIYNTERGGIKIEGGSSIIVQNNIIDTTTTDPGSGLQVQCAVTTKRVLISGNILSNVVSGIMVQAAVGGVTIDSVTISNNQVHTTTGSDVADGILIVNLTVGNALIQGNVLTDIKRNGIDLSGQMSRALIDGNVLSGQTIGNTIGIWLVADVGNWSLLKLSNNQIENFCEFATANAPIHFERSAAYTFGGVTVQGNSIRVNGAGNRAIYAQDIITSGIISDNYTDGLIEVHATGMEIRNNISGTITRNVSVTGNAQGTVGAAGGASALPATPTGYAIINKDGTEYVVPYYAK